MARIGGFGGMVVASVAALWMPVLAIAPAAAGEHSGGSMKSPHFWGTWYAELDAEPFGLPPGTALAALMTVHRDGTLQLFDAGDFGAPPIAQLQSPQYGSWRKSGPRSFRATTLFFAADPATQDTTLVKRVRFRMRLEGRGSDHLVGVAESVDQLACPAGPLPGFLSCPNPITAPEADWVPEPGGAPNVSFQAWRLRVD